MKNFLQPGRALAVVTPSGGLVSGQAVLIGNLFGVAAYSAAAAAEVEIVVEGVFTLPKAASPIEFAQGDKVYWDNTALNCTSTATSNKWIGVAIDGLGTASASTVNVRLNGFPQ
jgi:predicted RecA/RadA family phage recombinase